MATASPDIRQLDYQIDRRHVAAATELRSAPSKEVWRSSELTAPDAPAASRFTVGRRDRTETRVRVTAPAVGLRTYIDGVVVEAGDATVICDVGTGQETLRISLSRGLFAGAVEYGMPMRLKLVEERGVRRAVVEIRAISDTEDRKSELQRLEALIQTL